MKNALRLVAGLVLSAIFLLLAVRGVSWNEVVEALSRAHLGYVPLISGGMVIPLLFRALRWQVLIEPVHPVGIRRLFSATCIGFAANMLLPLRAGEIVRPWVISRREPVPFAQAMGTIALERLFDMGALLLLFSVAALTLPLPAEWHRYGWVFLAIFAGLLGVLVVATARPESWRRIVTALLQPLPDAMGKPVLRLFDGFVDGLRGLGSSRAVAVAGLHSLGVWLSISLSFGFGLSSLGLEVPWFRAAIAVTTLVAIAVAIPGGPGFIGMFQVGCVVALEAFGVERSVAFSYSVLTHAVQFATVVVLGVAFFFREGLRVSDVRPVEAEALGS